jgi:hypothetical protein
MENDRSYYKRRAAEQLAAAERADDVVTAEIHRSLAARMLAKAGEAPVQDAGRPMPPLTPPPAGVGQRPADG